MGERDWRKPIGKSTSASKVDWSRNMAPRTSRRDQESLATSRSQRSMYRRATDRVRTKAPLAPTRVPGERRLTRARQVQARALRPRSREREMRKTKAMTQQEETGRVGATMSSQRRPTPPLVHREWCQMLLQVSGVRKERYRKVKKDKERR